MGLVSVLRPPVTEESGLSASITWPPVQLSR